ncbi:MAG: flavodoxin domain-containing protein [Methylococcaceae bacterium]|nr:flavodoxin domain-containing protein [Methylococcaceae bacterium]
MVRLNCGTAVGSTRLVAKKIYSLLGEELADKPKNINRTRPEDLLAYGVFILATPRYGVGDLPGMAVGCNEVGWAEFVPYLDGVDLTGKRIALFGRVSINLEKLPAWPNSRIDELLPLTPEWIETLKQNRLEKTMWSG